MRKLLFGVAAVAGLFALSGTAKAGDPRCYGGYPGYSNFGPRVVSPGFNPGFGGVPQYGYSPRVSGFNRGFNYGPAVVPRASFAPVGGFNRGFNNGFPSYRVAPRSGISIGFSYNRGGFYRW